MLQAHRRTRRWHGGVRAALERRCVAGRGTYEIVRVDRGACAPTKSPAPLGLVPLTNTSRRADHTAPTHPARTRAAPSCSAHSACQRQGPPVGMRGAGVCPGDGRSGEGPPGWPHRTTVQRCWQQPAPARLPAHAHAQACISPADPGPCCPARACVAGQRQGPSRGGHRHGRGVAAGQRCGR